MEGYIVVVKTDEENDGYIAEFPNLDSVDDTTTAPTSEQALHEAARLVERHIEDLQKAGEEIPDPQPATELFKTVEGNGGVAGACIRAAA